MTRRSWERSIWALTGVVLALTIRQALSAGSSSTDKARGAVAQAVPAPAMTMFADDLLDSAAVSIASHDPFRVERRPANIAFSITPNGVPRVPPPMTPAIRIALQGTLGGPPWSAIISGVPGHDGTVVVSAGDTLGGVEIRRVTRDTVTVRVKDSVWTVTQPKAGM